MTGQAAFELGSEFRFACNDLFVTRFTVYVRSSLESLNLLVHTGSFEMAAFTLGNFLLFSLCVRNLLAVLGAVMAITTFGNFLMFGVWKYGRLWFFRLVFHGLQAHIGRTVVCNDDTGAKEKNSPKYTDNDFFWSWCPLLFKFEICQKYN